MSVELVFAGPNADCGCREEHYVVNLIDTIIHAEEDGSVEVFMDGGDWGEAETTIRGCSSFREARSKAIAWARSITGDE